DRVRVRRRQVLRRSPRRRVARASRAHPQHAELRGQLRRTSSPARSRRTSRSGVGAPAEVRLDTRKDGESRSLSSVAAMRTPTKMKGECDGKATETQYPRHLGG